MDKTIVMRILDQKKIDYEVFTYDGEGLSGSEIAMLLNEDSNYVYKTLVTQGSSKRYYVFDIPVDCELDLKKCAKIVNEKSIDMIKSKDLLGLTGYVHGGCSPIGMKKSFPCFIHESVLNQDYIYISAGKVGAQIKISKKSLISLCNFKICDIIKGQ